jgi:hypothetical protein
MKWLNVDTATVCNNIQAYATIRSFEDVRMSYIQLFNSVLY